MTAMPTRRPRRLAVLLLGLWLALAGQARAQLDGAPPGTSPAMEAQAPLLDPVPTPPPVTSADYEAALAEALEAHARGDYAQARIFMERAHSLDPSARTLRGLGIVAFAQGRHLESIRYLDAALASDVKPLPPDLRAGVDELLAHAWGQVASFEIVIEPSGTFWVDGRSPDFYAPNRVVLSPGAHLIRARAPSRADYELQVEAKAGDRRTLQIVLARPPEPVVVERVLDAPENDPFWNPRKRRFAWISGATLIGAGAAVYGLAYARLDDIADRCRNMVDGACTPQRAEKLYRRENIAGLGITAGVLAGAGVLTFVTATLFELSARRRAAPPGGAGARVQVTWNTISVAGRF
jgi:tetratricopeptide (TPR) repeat protein